MSTPSNTESIIVCLDDSGIVTALKISYQNQKHSISSIKQFNAHLVSHDNSVWSVDTKYPYIIIGGNHKGVLVFNYENESQEENEILCNKSVLYSGNENNVPGVRISPCGLFIACNSIDSFPKIFDVYNKKMICKVDNVKKEWGWNVIFVPKRLFSYKEFFYDFVSNDNETNYVTNLFQLDDANLTNKNSIYKHSDENQLVNEDSNDFYYYRYLQDNLINQYYILSTYNNIAYLNELVLEKTENNEDDSLSWKITDKPLGKIELFRNYLIERFRGYDNLTVMDIVILKQIKSFGRYEYLFISESMRLLFIGNKTGDLQIFRMVIEVGECDDKIGIIDIPDVIIDYYEKLAGIRVIEDEDGNSVDVYAVDLKGTFHQHRITRKDEGKDGSLWKCEEIQNEYNMEIDN